MGFFSSLRDRASQAVDTAGDIASFAAGEVFDIGRAAFNSRNGGTDILNEVERDEDDLRNDGFSRALGFSSRAGFSPVKRSTDFFDLYINDPEHPGRNRAFLSAMDSFDRSMDWVFDKGENAIKETLELRSKARRDRINRLKTAGVTGARVLGIDSLDTQEEFDAYFAPTPEPRAADFMRELGITTFQKTGDFADKATLAVLKGIVTGPSKFTAPFVAEGLDQDEIVPNNGLEKFFLPSEVENGKFFGFDVPENLFQQRITDVRFDYVTNISEGLQEKFDFDDERSEKYGKRSFGVGLFALGALEFSGLGPGGAGKSLFKNLIKETDVDKVAAALGKDTDLTENAIKTVSARIAKATDEEGVRNAVHTAEIISEAEKKLGGVLPDELLRDVIKVSDEAAASGKIDTKIKGAEEGELRARKTEAQRKAERDRRKTVKEEIIDRTVTASRNIGRAKRQGAAYEKQTGKSSGVQVADRVLTDVEDLRAAFEEVDGVISETAVQITKSVTEGKAGVEEAVDAIRRSVQAKINQLTEANPRPALTDQDLRIIRQEAEDTASIVAKNADNKSKYARYTEINEQIIRTADNVKDIIKRVNDEVKGLKPEKPVFATDPKTSALTRALEKSGVLEDIEAFKAIIKPSKKGGKSGDNILIAYKEVKTKNGQVRRTAKVVDGDEVNSLREKGYSVDTATKHLTDRGFKDTEKVYRNILESMFDHSRRTREYEHYKNIALASNNQYKSFIQRLQSLRARRDAIESKNFSKENALRAALARHRKVYNSSYKAAIRSLKKADRTRDIVLQGRKRMLNSYKKFLRTQGADELVSKIFNRKVAQLRKMSDEEFDTMLKDEIEPVITELVRKERLVQNIQENQNRLGIQNTKNILDAYGLKDVPVGATPPRNISNFSVAEMEKAAKALERVNEGSEVLPPETIKSMDQVYDEVVDADGFFTIISREDLNNRIAKEAGIKPEEMESYLKRLQKEGIPTIAAAGFRSSKSLGNIDPGLKLIADQIVRIEEVAMRRTMLEVREMDKLYASALKAGPSKAEKLATGKSKVSLTELDEKMFKFLDSPAADGAAMMLRFSPEEIRLATFLRDLLEEKGKRLTYHGFATRSGYFAHTRQKLVETLSNADGIKGKFSAFGDFIKNSGRDSTFDRRLVPISDKSADVTATAQFAHAKERSDLVEPSKKVATVMHRYLHDINLWDQYESTKHVIDAMVDLTNPKTTVIPNNLKPAFEKSAKNVEDVEQVFKNVIDFELRGARRQLLAKPGGKLDLTFRALGTISRLRYLAGDIGNGLGNFAAANNQLLQNKPRAFINRLVDIVPSERVRSWLPGDKLTDEQVKAARDIVKNEPGIVGFSPRENLTRTSASRLEKLGTFTNIFDETTSYYTNSRGLLIHLTKDDIDRYIKTGLPLTDQRRAEISREMFGNLYAPGKNQSSIGAIPEFKQFNTFAGWRNASIFNALDITSTSYRNIKRAVMKNYDENGNLIKNTDFDHQQLKKQMWRFGYGISTSALGYHLYNERVRGRDIFNETQTERIERRVIEDIASQGVGGVSLGYQIAFMADNFFAKMAELNGTEYDSFFPESKDTALGFVNDNELNDIREFFESYEYFGDTGLINGDLFIEMTGLGMATFNGELIDEPKEYAKRLYNFVGPRGPERFIKSTTGVDIREIVNENDRYRLAERYYGKEGDISNVQLKAAEIFDKYLELEGEEGQRYLSDAITLEEAQGNTGQKVLGHLDNIIILERFEDADKEFVANLQRTMYGPDADKKFYNNKTRATAIYKYVEDFRDGDYDFVDELLEAGQISEDVVDKVVNLGIKQHEYSDEELELFDIMEYKDKRAKRILTMFDIDNRPQRDIGEDFDRFVDAGFIRAKDENDDVLDYLRPYLVNKFGEHWHEILDSVE
jgi:hypothetical protein